MDKKTALLIAQELYNRKAHDIVVLDVRHMTVLTDYLVIASGNNALQVKALSDYLLSVLAQKGIVERRVEGMADGRWVVMDFSDVMVHLFHPEERAYYRLDQLWKDGSNRVALPFDEEEE